MGRSLRLHIAFSNMRIAVDNIARALGRELGPAMREMGAVLCIFYERLQRQQLYHRLPRWLPFRDWIVRHWPRRWLPRLVVM